MKLSKQKFNDLLQKNKLAISFIGMSNMGKTYWSKQFATIHFTHKNCDDMIETKLAPELIAHGYSGIADVSRWMGQPYEKRSFANQQKYLVFEKEVMKQMLTELKNDAKQNTVIDTTGSVIHTGARICATLKKRTLMIYIKATDDMKEVMFKKYIAEPKPVIFGNVFNQKKGESNTEALKRCYKKLLTVRSALYKKYADVVIPREAISEKTSLKQFITLVEKML